MSKYISHLLILVLGTVSTCIITPCHAQTAVKSDSQNTNNISSTSSSSPSTIQMHDSLNSTNNKQTIISETVSNSSAPKPNLTATQAQLRIPIFSRIFRSPLMQQ
ncbi:hypothetical protein [Nostoc sp. PA-18-2419]|uniref:hypothetical protein n=1 Tax=Nostoc sp. PA-18-2419 TaxID=2575443 RepID=UPI0011087FB0|nr:hypothetical protein [Nostoc sp. PA-18-2419]